MREVTALAGISVGVTLIGIVQSFQAMRAPSVEQGAIGILGLLVSWAAVRLDRERR